MQDWLRNRLALCRLSVVLSFTALLCGSLCAAESSVLQLGRARIDITPEPGTPMLTPQSRRFVKLSEPARDALSVRAVVLHGDHTKAALVACDLTSIPNPMLDDARQRITQATGIPGDAIMISATHTHTAPQIRARFLTELDESARKKGLHYLETLPGRIAEAVAKANGALQPCVVSAGIGREETISFNRRFVMQDGSVMTSPGKTDPAQFQQIVRPAGPIDPEVGVVLFQSPDRRPLATLVNFSLHPDTDGGATPSADFPATLHQRLADAWGPDLLSFFALGASGNVNHYNLLDPKNPRRVKGRDESARIGNQLAATVLETCSKLRSLEATRLRFARRTIALDMPREKGLALAARHDHASQFFDGEIEVHNASGRQWFEAEVQVIALGSELAWVGLPGEMFVELGMALKLASPYRYTMIHQLANRSIGYVPNLRAYPEGAYEVLATRCAPGSGEILVNAATELLITVKHQR